MSADKSVLSPVSRAQNAAAEVERERRGGAAAARKKDRRRRHVLSWEEFKSAVERREWPKPTPAAAPLDAPTHCARSRSALLPADDDGERDGDGEKRTGCEHELAFKVDRRKVECLMRGEMRAISGAADDFFAGVEDATDTVVLWPTKLKVGGRSKRDIWIFVGGHEEQKVRQAKSLIQDYLQSKTSMSSLKLNVSHTAHSHIIGLKGRRLRAIQKESKCHIHMPDSNRWSGEAEKSNAVSISGESVAGIELARARIRQVSPLVFSFKLPFQSGRNSSRDPVVAALQQRHNVFISIRHHFVPSSTRLTTSSLVTVSGCEQDSAAVCAATVALVNYLCHAAADDAAAADAVPVSTTMEIGPQHLAAVQGLSVDIGAIQRRTNAAIISPQTPQTRRRRRRRWCVAQRPPNSRV